MLEARNRAANGSRKWMGAPTTGVCEPHGGSPGWQLLPRCTLDLWLVARVGLWGEHVHGHLTPGRGWPKVNGGHATGACWAPRAVNWDRRLHCMCHLYCDPRGRHQGCQHAKPSGYGVAVLNCMKELKNRPFRTATRGLKSAAGHMLATFSTLQLRPTCSSLINGLNCVFCNVLEVHSGCWANSVVSRYSLFCLVRNYWRTHVGDWSVITWRDCTCRGWGSSPPPPPPEVMHVCTPFSLRGLKYKRPQVISKAVYTGRGRWSRAILQPDLALGGRGYLAGPPPIDWVEHACYHPPIFNFST